MSSVGLCPTAGVGRLAGSITVSEVSKEEVIAYLSALQPGELGELLLDLEELWGIERLAVPRSITTMGAPLYELEELEEQRRGTDVLLLDVGPRRVLVMKAIRQVLGGTLELAQSRVNVGQGGLLAESLELHVAERLRVELVAVGAKIELRSR